MKTNLSRILLITVSIVIGFIFIFSGIDQLALDKLSEVLGSALFGVAKTDAPKAAIALSFGIVFVFATLILVSPISLAGGMFFLRLSYTLMFGKYANDTVFYKSSMNTLISLLCVLFFFMSFYIQYKWIDKTTKLHIGMSKDKSLTKFI